MKDNLSEIKQEFVTGLSHISGFWGFPKGMGAIFAVLYLSPDPLSLDELVAQTGLTKGAISTDVRALARLGLVHPSSRLGDRKDYYAAETDFYRAVRAILKERRDSDFDRAVATVGTTLDKLQAGSGKDGPEETFLIARLQALKDFFDAIDALVNAVARLDSLGVNTVQTVLKILK
jgi:HTH-type transcriptional regulator, glycine betaine synthesis regulator